MTVPSTRAMNLQGLGEIISIHHRDGESVVTFASDSLKVVTVTLDSSARRSFKRRTPCTLASSLFASITAPSLMTLSTMMMLPEERDAAPSRSIQECSACPHR